MASNGPGNGQGADEDLDLYGKTMATSLCSILLAYLGDALLIRTRAPWCRQVRDSRSNKKSLQKGMPKAR